MSHQQLSSIKTVPVSLGVGSHTASDTNDSLSQQVFRNAYCNINFRDSQWSSLKRQDHFHYFVSNFSHCSHRSCFARDFSPLQLNLSICNETFLWNISVFESLCSDCVCVPFVFCECSVLETYWHEHSLKMNFKDACPCHHGN